MWLSLVSKVVRWLLRFIRLQPHRALCSPRKTFSAQRTDKASVRPRNCTVPHPNNKNTRTPTCSWHEHLDQLSKADTITFACLLKIGLRAFKELSQNAISWVAQVAFMKSLNCSDIHLGSGWSLITFFV